MVQPEAPLRPTSHAVSDRWRVVRHYAYLAGRLDEAAAVLAADAEAVVAGDGNLSHLHAHVAGVGVSRTARLHVGPVAQEEHVLHVPLRWEDERQPRLFPTLHAVLSVTELRSSRRAILQVGLVGHYQPPLGAFGDLADRMAGEDVAAESVAGYVRQVVERLQARLPDGAALHAALHAGPGDEPDIEPGARRILIPVDNFDRCEGGAVAVERHLAATPGVVRSDVDPLTGLVAVDYLPQRCRLRQLLDELDVDSY